METQLSFIKKQGDKLKHITACLMGESQYDKSAGFDQIDLIHDPAAGLSLDDISLSTNFVGKTLKVPLMIAPMTGGMERAAILNERFAKAAECFGIAFGVGSQRLALVDEKVQQSFLVRRFAKDALVFANLGAAQILHGCARDALRAVQMIEADALFIHLNPLQEACQRNGDTNFVGVLRAIEQVATILHRQNVPVLVREVGFGLSKKSAMSLIETGIYGLDCAGAGGTSWTKVEALCADSDEYRKLGEVFGEWGIPTAESIRNVRSVDKSIPLVACGGIRSGLDVAKALALGANVAGLAMPMLRAAMHSEERLFSFIDEITRELKVAMFAAGAATPNELVDKI